MPLATLDPPTWHEPTRKLPGAVLELTTSHTTPAAKSPSPG